MVSVSPRLRDDLDYTEDPEPLDPRFVLGFRSFSIAVAGYEQYEAHEDDHRPWSATHDPAAVRRRRRQRHSDSVLHYALPFQYATIADGDAFRLAILHPGTGTAPVECRLVWESSKSPRQDYRCLSYCWETVDRTAAILCDGYRFPVTQNLLRALQNIRSPTADVRIWVDQICINQGDYKERAHQVSIMKHIFTKAKEVIIWLGEADDRSEKLCEYARRMGRGQHVRYSPKSALSRIMTPRQLQDALQRLLQRPWFKRVWVIPEVALARFAVVAIGSSRMSWDNLVRLVKDTQLPGLVEFDKQTSLLGNPRQRIAIITQMGLSQSKRLFHTDVSQLLILAKSSDATDVRDKVYSFFGLTLLTTVPDYRDIPDRKTSVERLYVEIAEHYVNSILYVDEYSRWHGLSDQMLTQQLMSVLYSAGRLHQHYNLPSWVPDWTYRWYQAPLWCKTDANLTTITPRDTWTTGIRSEYRAGGDNRETFELVRGSRSRHHLHVSIIVVDTVAEVSVDTPVSTPALGPSPISPSAAVQALLSPTYSYGRDSFKTVTGYLGGATSGIREGDIIAIIIGGDVPVVLRPASGNGGDLNAYILLCECFVHSAEVMQGDYVDHHWTHSRDIVLI